MVLLFWANFVSVVMGYNCRQFNRPQESNTFFLRKLLQVSSYLLLMNLEQACFFPLDLFLLNATPLFIFIIISSLGRPLLQIYISLVVIPQCYLVSGEILYDSNSYLVPNIQYFSLKDLPQRIKTSVVESETFHQSFLCRGYQPEGVGFTSLACFFAVGNLRFCKSIFSDLQ